jgi:hypothetical protein
MTKFLSILFCAAPLAFAAPVLAQSTAGQQPDVAASASKPVAKLMLLARHGADDGANHDKGDDRGGRRDG